MCSIGEDDFGDEGGTHAMVPTQKELTSNDENRVSQCKKCKAENVVVYKVYLRGLECRDCFLMNARHKFRATLGSSKVLPRDAKVLLIFDGSAEAVVLLDMLYHAQTQNNFKRLHCSACILFIDESILAENDVKSAERVLEIQEHLNAYTAFPSFITSIASTNETPCLEFKNAATHLERDRQSEADFAKRLAAIRSLTSRQDFIKYHRNHLIANAAKQLDCAYVFLSDISTTLATQLLTSIALGRGASAAFDVALVDDRLGHDIQIIRPLRDLNQAEIELYLHVQSLPTFKSKEDCYGANRGASASLQNLTSDFMSNLQENYSATVSTVFRSCDKIAPNRTLHKQLSAISLKDQNEDDAVKDAKTVCSFCNSPFETASCNTLLAIEFSRLVSERGASTNRSTDLDSLACENLNHMNDLKPLCHACRNIEKDSSIELLKRGT